MVCNLALGLPLVLGVFVANFDGFGFAACPWVVGFRWLKISVIVPLLCF